MEERIFRTEWDAWQRVVNELERIGVPIEVLNREGASLIAYLDEWSARRAALIAFNQSRRPDGTTIAGGI